MKSKSDYRILLVDDHHLMRQGLRTLINGVPGMRVVAEANRGEEALEKLRSNPCDLLVIDLSMPGMDGFQVLETLARAKGEFKVLVLTMHKEKVFLRKSLALGVDGYILKDDAFEQLINAIQTIRSGRKAFSTATQEAMVADYAAARGGHLAEGILSARERETLVMLVDGLTNKEIARRLSISIRTAEAHRANLMRKLGVNSMASLVRFAMDNNLV